MSNINLSKAGAFAGVITGKQVRVVAGNVGEGPFTNGRVITMGKAMNWDLEDRFAILVHECAHLIFPANYPGGNIRELANLIDDSRIERQFIKGRPHYADSLGSLAINVIANGYYDEPETPMKNLGKLAGGGQVIGVGETKVKDRWSEAEWDPCMWALLFFRPHVGEEVRLAVADALNAYAIRKGYDKVEGWKDKLNQLTQDGQRITRLKTVSKETLEAWCKLYCEVFPDATKDVNSKLAVAILKDQPAPKGEQKDQEGAGSAKADKKIREKSQGKGEKSQGGDQTQDDLPEDGEEGEGEGEGEGEESEEEGKDAQGKGKGEEEESEEGETKKPSQKGSKGQQQGKEEDDSEAKAPADLEGALENLKKLVGKVGQEKKEDSKQAAQDAGQGESETKGIKEGDEEVDVGDEDPTVSGGIGREKAVMEVHKLHQAVDNNFVNRVKMSIRKLRTLVIDTMAGRKKVGRLNLPVVLTAERKGILPKKPFISTIEDITDAPVACVVATDFSGSTCGSLNDILNKFAHNAIYALQSAGCECAEVVWNTEAKITKTIDQQISGVQFGKHESDGGTCLVAASSGCITALQRAKSQRKIAFVFTDGCVYEQEVPVAAKHFKDAGFEAVLLVSVGQSVKRSGIISTEVCNDVNALVGIFDRWVRQQMVKVTEGALAS